MNATTKIKVTKKCEGRPIEFYAYGRHENVVCHGRIRKVTRQFIIIADPCFPGSYPANNEPWADMMLPHSANKVVAVW